MADEGGCSANEATSFASVSVAKRLCRIVRVVDYEIAVFITILKVTPLRRLHLIRAAKAAHLLLKEKAFGVCACQRMQGAWNPLIRLANRSTPSPQFGIVVFEQMNCSNTRCLIEPAPALFCHRQGRYSGFRLGEGFYGCAIGKRRECMSY